MSTSKRVNLINLNKRDGAEFTTCGMQLYEGMSVKFVKAMPRCENPELFFKALSRLHTTKCKLDDNATVTDYHPHGSIVTTGSISVRFSLKGTSTFEKVAEVNPEKSYPEGNCGDISRLCIDFEPDKEDKDLFDIAFPISLDRRGNLRCQITFPCDLEIKTYGDDELLTSDR